jgi:hypothetical protein
MITTLCVYHFFGKNEWFLCCDKTVNSKISFLFSNEKVWHHLSQIFCLLVHSNHWYLAPHSVSYDDITCTAGNIKWLLTAEIARTIQFMKVNKNEGAKHHIHWCYDVWHSQYKNHCNVHVRPWMCFDRNISKTMGRHSTWF